MTEIEQMHADILMLRASIAEAKSMVASWGAYAGEYFQEKWDLQGNIAELEQALSATEHYEGK